MALSLPIRRTRFLPGRNRRFWEPPSVGCRPRQRIATASCVDGSAAPSPAGINRMLAGFKIAMDDAIGVRCLHGPRQHFNKL